MFDPSTITKKAVVKAPRIQVIATQGFGKTSFAACMTNEGKDKTEDTEKCIIVPIDGETGADGLPVSKTPTMTSFADLLAFMDYFIANECPYTRIVFDSTSALEPLINKDVCRRHDVDNVKKVKGFRVGEMEVQNTWLTFLNRCDQLREKGVEIVLTTHAKTKKYNAPDSEGYDRYVPDLEEFSAAIIDKWCDIVAFGHKEILIKKDDLGFGGERTRAMDGFGERFLFLEPSATRPGKRRPEFSRMPSKVPLDHAAFKAAMIESVNQVVNL